MFGMGTGGTSLLSPPDCLRTLVGLLAPRDRNRFRASHGRNCKHFASQKFDSPLLNSYDVRVCMANAALKTKQS